MRVGLIGDIHGNTVALDAVLTELEEQRVTLIVCLGDVATNGPDPAGAVDRVAQLACPTVMGNSDADVIDMPEWWRDPAAVGAPETARRVIEISRWCASRLDDSHREFLAGLPTTADIDLGHGYGLFAFHGSPRSATDIITSTTPPEELDGMVAGAHQQLLAGGHTHVPMVRRHRSQTIVNPGSVGLPFDTYATPVTFLSSTTPPTGFWPRPNRD